MTTSHFVTFQAHGFLDSSDPHSLSVGSSMTSFFVDLRAVFGVALVVSFGMALEVSFGAAVGAGFCPFFERGKGISSTNPSEAVDSFSVTDYQAEDIHTHPHCHEHCSGFP